VPGANPDCPLEKPLSDLRMYDRFQTLEASPDAAYHQRGRLRGRPYDLADAAESARFRERRTGPGDLSPRDCQIEHGGSTPLQLADPPSLEMLARKRGPVHTQFGPILATIRERPPKRHAPRRRNRGLVKPRALTSSDGSKGTGPTKSPARQRSRPRRSPRRT
jgi:hypothetical protein